MRPSAFLSVDGGVVFSFVLLILCFVLVLHISFHQPVPFIYIHPPPSTRPFLPSPTKLILLPFSLCQHSRSLSLACCVLFSLSLYQCATVTVLYVRPPTHRAVPTLFFVTPPSYIHTYYQSTFGLIFHHDDRPCATQVTHSLASAAASGVFPVAVGHSHSYSRSTLPRSALASHDFDGCCYCYLGLNFPSSSSSSSFFFFFSFFSILSV